MKVENLRIENYKCFQDSQISIGNLLSLIGENSSGKSSVLNALEITLGNKNPTLRDFNNNTLPITITIVFSGIENLDWKKYFDFFNTNKLTIKWKWEPTLPIKKTINIISKQPNEELLRPWTSDVGIRDTHRLMFKKRVYGIDFERYLDVRDDYMHISRNKWFDAAYKFIKEQFERIKWKTVESKILEKTFFLGQILPQFLIVPSIFSTEEMIAPFLSDGNEGSRGLALLLEEKARNLNDEIKQTLQSYISQQSLNEQDEFVTIKEFLNRFQDIKFQAGLNVSKIPFPEVLFEIKLNDGIESRLEEKGHGLQRLVAFGQLLATLRQQNIVRSLRNKEPRDFIIAFEEVQLYLHPLYQSIMLDQLKDISKSGSLQIIYTTHSATTFDPFELDTVGIVRKRENKSTIYQLSYENIAKKVNKAINFQSATSESIRHRIGELLSIETCESLFSRLVIIVEGETEKYSLPLLFDSIKFSLKQKGISIVGVGGKSNIERLVYLLDEFAIPYYCIFDQDKSISNRASQETTKRLFSLLKITPFDELYCISDLASVFREDFEDTLTKLCPLWQKYDQEGIGIIGARSGGAKGLRARYTSQNIGNIITKEKYAFPELVQYLEGLAMAIQGRMD